MARRQDRERRTSTARRRAEKHESGYATSTIRVPDGVSFFSPEKGMFTLTIVPYKVGKGNPFADAGETHYERTFWIYRGIGPDEKSYVSPSKTFNEKDYIQEFRQEEARKSDADKDLLKSLNPKERQIFLVFDHADKGKGIQLWEFSYHNFGKLLDTRIKNSPESRGWDLFYLPDEDGFDLEITFTDESMGSYSFTEASAIDFIPRDKPLDDALVNHGICLDDLLIKLSYDELRAAFQGVPIEEDEDEEREGPRRSRKQEMEKEEEKSEEPPPKEKKPKKEKTEPATAMDAGLAKGDIVTYKGMSCEIMRISGDGTSLTLLDPDDDPIKAIGVHEVEKAEKEEETPWDKDFDDEPKKEKKKEKAAKSTKEELDDDWN